MRTTTWLLASTLSLAACGDAASLDAAHSDGTCASLVEVPPRELGASPSFASSYLAADPTTQVTLDLPEVATAVGQVAACVADPAQPGVPTCVPIDRASISLCGTQLEVEPDAPLWDGFRRWTLADLRAASTVWLTVGYWPDAPAATGEIDSVATTPLAPRGQVEVAWRYGAEPRRGEFLVERSAGGTFSMIDGCRWAYATGNDYHCTDTGLSSNRWYYYRVCFPSLSVTSCDGVADTVYGPAVRAP